MGSAESTISSLLETVEELMKENKELKEQIEVQKLALGGEIKVKKQEIKREIKVTRYVSMEDIKTFKTDGWFEDFITSSIPKRESDKDTKWWNADKVKNIPIVITISQ